MSGVGVEGVLGGVCGSRCSCASARGCTAASGANRATERDVAAQHAKMERAVARREEELARGERNAVANRAKQARVLHAGDEKSAPGDGGGGRRGGVTRGAFEPRRPGGDDEEPERDGMEDDEVPEGVYDAPAAPRDSAWSLAAGLRALHPFFPHRRPRPRASFARGWAAGKTGGLRPQWAGAAAAARRAAEGARGGLYAGGGGGGATRETMNAPPLDRPGRFPRGDARDGSSEHPPVPVIVTRRRDGAEDRVAPGAVTAAPSSGPRGTVERRGSGGGAVGSTSRFVG